VVEILGVDMPLQFYDAENSVNGNAKSGTSERETEFAKSEATNPPSKTFQSSKYHSRYRFNGSKGLLRATSTSFQKKHDCRPMISVIFISL
jgi:hypothetical protein